MTRTILAHDDDEPICDPCALALGMQPTDKPAPVSMQTCCLCGNERRCMAIRDGSPTLRRHEGKSWAARDDEIANLMRIIRIGAIMLLAAAALAIAWSPALAHEPYRGDHIDAERRANRKALRQHNCFWYGADCPGWARRYRHRKWHATPSAPASIDSGVTCHRRTEATGEQAQSKDAAEERALRAWQGRVRFHFGERFLDFGNARDAKIACSPSSVADTVGGKIQDKLLGISHYRCEISARPCRAPARKVNRGED